VDTNRIDTVSIFHPTIDSVTQPTGFPVWIASCGPVDLTFATEEEIEAFFVGGMRLLREAQGVTMPTPLVGHLDDLLDEAPADIVAECTVEVRDLTPGDLIQLRGRWLEVAGIDTSPPNSFDGTWCVHFIGTGSEHLMPGDAVQLGRRVDACGGGAFPRARQPREHAVPCRGCSTPSHPVMTLDPDAYCDGCRNRAVA
jgi:hypothetical protein